MKLISLITPDLIMSDNMAIVGSSGKLIGSNYREKIDGFDEVVRFNRAVVDEHKQDVGKKTTLRVANAAGFSNLKEDNTRWPGLDSDFYKKIRDVKVLFCAPAIFENAWIEGLRTLDKSCSAYRIKDLSDMKKKFGVGKKDLTVGLTFILLAVNSFIVPYVFGFDTEIGIPRTHYWAERPAPGPCHDLGMETRLLKKLNEEGKIILL